MPGGLKQDVAGAIAYGAAQESEQGVAEGLLASGHG
jgi:hypothetical protein